MADKNPPRREHSDVIFQLSGDALRPTEAPWGFMARNPVQRVVPPGASIEIDLQVSANVPLMAFPTRALSDSAFFLNRDRSGRLPMTVFTAGSSVRISIENRGQSPLVLDDKEPLACLHPLVFSGSSELG